VAGTQADSRAVVGHRDGGRAGPTGTLPRSPRGTGADRRKCRSPGDTVPWPYMRHAAGAATSRAPARRHRDEEPAMNHRHVMRLFAGLAIACAWLGAGAAPASAPATEDRSVTTGHVVVGGKDLAYRAETGHIVVRSERGKPAV